MDPFNDSGRIAAPQYLSLSSLLVNNLSCTERSVWGKEGALNVPLKVGDHVINFSKGGNLWDNGVVIEVLNPSLFRMRGTTTGGFQEIVDNVALRDILIDKPQADIWVPAAISKLQASDILASEVFILFGSITLNGNLIVRQDVAPTVAWAEEGTSIGIITEATADLLGTNVNNTDMCGSFTFLSAGGGTVGDTANDIEVTVTYNGTYVKPPVPILNVWFSDITDAQSWLGAGTIEITSYDEIGFTVTFLGDGASSIWSAGGTIALVWHSQGRI